MKNKFMIIIPLVVVCIIFAVGFMVFVTSTQTQTQIPPEIAITLTPSETKTPLYALPENTLETNTPIISEWQPLNPLPITSRYLHINGDRTTNKVALTFDLCQGEGYISGYDTAIVQVLIETQTPATFFLGGLWMRDHIEATKELASIPFFELGNHSWSHLNFKNISPDVMSEEILKTQSLMWDLLGYQTNIFRFPYGLLDPDGILKDSDQKALNVVREHGLYAIEWDVVSGDPDRNATAEKMIPWVLQQVEPGSIIIMHANERGWHTAEALPDIIQGLRANGYELVTVSELLNIAKP